MYHGIATTRILILFQFIDFSKVEDEIDNCMQSMPECRILNPQWKEAQ